MQTVHATWATVSRTEKAWNKTKKRQSTTTTTNQEREEKQSCGPTHTHNASNTTTHPNTQTHAHRRTQQTRTHTHAHTRVPIYTHVTRRNLECWRFLVPRSCGSHKLQNNNTNNNNNSGAGEGGWGGSTRASTRVPKDKGEKGGRHHRNAKDRQQVGCPANG